MLTRHVTALTMTVVCFACGCGTDSTSVDDETLTILVAGETASWVLRLVAAGVADPVDWSGTKQDIERRTLARVEETLGRIRCAKFTYNSDSSLTLSFDGCRLINRPNIQGTATFVASVTMSDDPRVRLDVDLPSLSWSDGKFEGSGTLATTRSTFGDFTGDLHIHHEGILKFDFEADGRFNKVDEKVMPCIEVNALGVVQSESAVVAMSFHDALYCSGRCGDDGTVVGAGRFLQHLRFSNRTATRSVGEGPAIDVPFCGR